MADEKKLMLLQIWMLTCVFLAHGRMIRFAQDAAVKRLSQETMIWVIFTQPGHPMHLILILLAILLFTSPAHAQLKNENLLVAMPDGYVTGFQDKNARQQITEMVPRGRSVKDWTDMVTVPQT